MLAGSAPVISEISLAGASQQPFKIARQTRSHSNVRATAVQITELI